MNRIAGQSILAGKRGDAAVFYSAEPALGGGPERAVPVESQVGDAAIAHPIGRRVRCANLTASKIGDATLKESEPKAPSPGISEKSNRTVLALQTGPRDLFDPTPRRQMKKAMFVVGDPQTSRSVLDDRT